MHAQYKIVGLTANNVDALRAVFAAEIEQGSVIVTATTAVFALESPAEELDKRMRELAGRVGRDQDQAAAYYRNSLHAVRRKLAKIERVQ